MNINKILKSKEHPTLSEFKLRTYNVQFTFGELADMVKRGDILIPKIQRDYVWSGEQSSKFIESIIMGLPIPSIIFAKREDERFLVVDGLQRLSTISSYIFERERMKFDKNDWTEKDSKKKWKLVGNISEEIKNKTFSELDDTYQRKIKYSSVSIIIFEEEHPGDQTSLIEIFSRINKEGTALNRQEIRNSVYQGTSNDLILSLNKEEKWRNIFGSVKTDKRMLDVEVIVRMFGMRLSMRFDEFNNYKKANFSVADLIDNTYEYLIASDISITNELILEFNNFIEWVQRFPNKILSLIDDKGKHKSTLDKNISETLFMIFDKFWDISFNVAYNNFKKLQQEYNNLFIAIFSEATNSTKRIDFRLRITQAALEHNNEKFTSFMKEIEPEIRKNISF